MFRLPSQEGFGLLRNQGSASAGIGVRFGPEFAVIPVKMEERLVPLPDGIADLVYMINLHHELEEPLKMLEESRRLLKKDGKLMIIDWKKEETPEGPPLELRFTEVTIESQMRKSGFSNIRKYAVLPYHHFLVGEKKA